MPLKSWSSLIDDADGAFEDLTPLPPADYDFEITKSEAKQSGNGKQMWKITCRVISGPYQGRLVWSQLVLSPENPTALGIFFRQMAAIGIGKEYFAKDPSDHQLAEELIGKKFRGQIGIKAYQGTDRNELKSYSPLKSAPNAAPGAPSPITNTPPQNAQPSPPPGPAPAPQSAPPAAASQAPQSAPVDNTQAPAPVSQPAAPPVADETPAAPPATNDAPPTLPDGDPF